MTSIFSKIDKLAGLETEHKIALWLERLAFVFLILMILFSPHSIAASQTAYILGMIFWLARFFIKPRPKFIKTALFIPFILYFAWAILTSIFSYAPDLSFDRLRNVSLFIIFFFVVNNLRNVKSVKFAALALVFSCMVNVIWTPISLLIGRGVEIQNMQKESPLAKADMQSGDTIVKANDKKVSSPEEVLAEFEKSEVVKITYYRPGYYWSENVKTSDLLNGESALAKLGFESWKKNGNWRVAGFFGHYTTYAEVLQLIGSLALGLFIAGTSGRWGDGEKRRQGEEEITESKVRNEDSENNKLNSEIQTKKSPPLSYSLSPLLFLFCVGMMAFALLLTVTRASQAAFLASAFSIVIVGASRKMVLILALIAIPIVIGGLVFLQQSRDVGFIDTKDLSTTWRMTVYREGLDLWTENPRHFLIGVGMDSINRYKDEWGLFDNGRLPPGHLHSTPLQLAVDRGLPALLIWLWIIGVFKLKLFKALRQNKFKDYIEKGIVLGAFGGLIGFFIGGLVHYNLGDGEVAMVFFILMGLGIKTVESLEK